MQIRLDKTKGAPYNKDCEQIGNVSRRLFSTANFPAAKGMGTAAGNRSIMQVQSEQIVLY